MGNCARKESISFILFFENKRKQFLRNYTRKVQLSDTIFVQYDAMNHQGLAHDNKNI